MFKILSAQKKIWLKLKLWVNMINKSMKYLLFKDISQKNIIPQLGVNQYRNNNEYST